MQVQLETCKRNKWVYEKIATQTKEAGYDRSADQCREKAKKLKGEYWKVKDKQGKTGTGHINWKYFDVLDILGNRPSTKPAVMIDTLRDSEDEATDITSDTDCSIKEGQKIADAQANGSDQPAQSSTATPTPTEGGGREDKIEQTMKGVVQQILASQEASDRLSLELEEKRMKFEEYKINKSARRERVSVENDVDDDAGTTTSSTILSPAVTWTIRIPPIHKWATHPG
jgi:hypothetical protein